MRPLNKICETNGGKIKEQVVPFTYDSPQVFYILRYQLFFGLYQTVKLVQLSNQDMLLNETWRVHEIN